jgi:hypothetical protein
VRLFVCALFFLMCVNESSATYAFYAEHMETVPFRWVRGLLFEPYLSVRLFDILFLGVLLYGSLRKGSSSPMTRPMRSALFVAASVTLGALAWGLLRGGDARAAGWQVYLPLAMVLVTFSLASVLRAPADFVKLAQTLVAAGVYRAIMAITFYLFYVRPGHISPWPDYMSSHEDTVLWTSGIAFLLMGAIVTPNARTRAAAAFIVPLFLLAIQFNNRRLAWISLGGALVTSYFLLPMSAAKRRVQRIARVLVPVLALYAAIGWERPETIFTPLRAFSSVSAAQDNSTKARNVENLGLIATAHEHGWLLGSGWGQRYVEVSDKYNIHFFELWPYVPHNSVLGLFAYTGYLGFVGYWMVFPVAIFFHARVARFATLPRERLVGLLGVIQAVCCSGQWYGDMGSFSIVTMYTLAACFASALRVPALAGVWPGKPKPPPSAEAPEIVQVPA